MKIFISSHFHYPRKGMSFQLSLHCALLSSFLGQEFFKDHLRIPEDLRVSTTWSKCKAYGFQNCRLNLFKMKETHREHFTTVSKYLLLTQENMSFISLGQLQIAVGKDRNSTRPIAQKWRNCGLSLFLNNLSPHYFLFPLLLFIWW